MLQYFTSLCTKLANPWHRFLRILRFCHSNPDIYRLRLPAYQNLGLGLDEMSRFEWQKHKILKKLCQGFAGFLHKLIYYALSEAQDCYDYARAQKCGKFILRGDTVRPGVEISSSGVRHILLSIPYATHPG